MLDGLYLWLKAFHIMAVIAWMAGLFYLPRLFVHHTERAMGDPGQEQVFQIMEAKLLRVIMNPAMIAAWVLGILLILSLGVGSVFSQGWFHVKLLALVGMTAFHMWLAARRKDFVAGRNTRSGRTYRIMNEVPTVLMIVIVIMVVVKPF
ncbi:protoporphyrinogen oxidase HemJ [Oceanibium sediminis]|uniref:protoporphyrinogen oxidase HemJ n=1 Tax=Oceanibium sediminis TaxID=2026339 RepID=UPI000DD2E3BC|nr:protoporphyrinogen oxidase HemJ [Oceanibium sediminis]